MAQPNREDEDKTRVHLFLYTKDVQRLHELFDNSIGFSGAVRIMVSQYLSRIDNAESAVAKPIPQIDLDITK